MPELEYGTHGVFVGTVTTRSEWRGIFGIFLRVFLYVKFWCSFEQIIGPKCSDNFLLSCLEKCVRSAFIVLTVPIALVLCQRDIAD